MLLSIFADQRRGILRAILMLLIFTYDCHFAADIAISYAISFSRRAISLMPAPLIRRYCAAAADITPRRRAAFTTLPLHHAYFAFATPFSPYYAAISAPLH
jgi:hypothetical protein